MNVVGIVCEYNPFHLGHQAMIRKLREQGAQTIVCAMSGNYVQRGEPAILPKQIRAEMAVECGADLVLELPTPWAMATAEIFARGAVSLLKMAGCDSIAFGSECGRLDLLQKTVELLSDEGVDECLQNYMKKGLTYAAARAQAVEDVSGECAEVLRNPNDLLAVEYLRAAGTSLQPIAVQRVGAMHDGEPTEGIASATYIRRCLCESRIDEAEKYLPAESIRLLEKAMENGMAPCHQNTMETALLFRLRQMSEEEFAVYDDGNEGLYHRVYRAVQQEKSFAEILENAKTKRYTMARLRRFLMCVCLGIQRVPESLPYARVLAASKQGQCQLRVMRWAEMPVLTKPADAGKLGEEAEKLMQKESVWTDLYALGLPHRESCGSDYRLSPIMKKEN